MSSELDAGQLYWQEVLASLKNAGIEGHTTLLEYAPDLPGMPTVMLTVDGAPIDDSLKSVFRVNPNSYYIEKYEVMRNGYYQDPQRQMLFAVRWAILVNKDGPDRNEVGRGGTVLREELYACNSKARAAQNEIYDKNVGKEIEIIRLD